jgi:outer membrane protein, multidrug efflux system
LFSLRLCVELPPLLADFLCIYGQFMCERWKMMKLRSCAAISVVLLMTTSCLLRPKYERPCVDVPDEWRFTSNPQSATVNIRWWEQFNDSVLNDLIVTAVANNYDLKIAVARVDQYYGRLGVVRSDLYPHLNANLSGFRQELSLKTIPSMTTTQFRYGNSYRAILNAAYEVDIWGRIHSAVDASLADLLAQEEVQRTVVITLVGATAGSYITLLQLDKQLDIGYQTFQSRKESYKLAKMRFEGGLTSEIEVKQTESAMQQAQIEIIRLERSIALEEDHLSVLLGMNSRDIPRGRTLEDLDLPPCIPAGLPSDLLEQRPDILRAEDILRATVSRVGVAKAAFFPRIPLTSLFGYQSAQLSHLFVNPAETWQYGLSILQPIFEGGRLISELDIAKAENREALYAYYSAILNGFKEVNDALISHQKNLELVKEQQAQVVVLSDYLELAHKQYNNGQTDYLNVLDAERTLFISQLSLAGLQGDAFRSLIDLYKALGGGWDLKVMSEENKRGFCKTGFEGQI